jgi:hypothetical protein
MTKRPTGSALIAELFVRAYKKWTAGFTLSKAAWTYRAIRRLAKELGAKPTCERECFACAAAGSNASGP